MEKRQRLECVFIRGIDGKTAREQHKEGIKRSTKLLSASVILLRWQGGKRKKQTLTHVMSKWVVTWRHERGGEREVENGDKKQRAQQPKDKRTG